MHISKGEIRSVFIRFHLVRQRHATFLYAVMRSDEEVILYADFNPDRVEYVEQRVLEFITQ